MQLDSEFRCNAVVWITSLDEQELGPSRRMAEDISALCDHNGFIFINQNVSRHSELVQVLKSIEAIAKHNNIYPILVFDAHGSQKDGLILSHPGEVISWDSLNMLLRPINVATSNNLFVIGAACYGLHVISTTRLENPAPFYMLLAPEHKVKVGFLEENLPRFFNQLFTLGSIDEAYKNCLSQAFTYFHCEKMLLVTLARYIQKYCKGSGAKNRRERLMTELFMEGMPNSSANRKKNKKKPQGMDEA